MSNVVAITPEQAYQIGEAQHKKALSYAARTGTAIDLVVVRGADAKEEAKMTPGRLRNAILKNLTPEEVNALPYPGSRWKNADNTPNNNPDIYEYKDPSKDANAKAREVSFYVDWADNTPEGKNVVARLEWVKRLGKPNMITDDIPAEFKAENANPEARDQTEKYLDGRRGTIRSAYKEAVRLIWQMDLVNELVVYQPIVDADGEPVLDDAGHPTYDTNVIVAGCTATMDPDGTTVQVKDRINPKNWEFLSVNTFLKLDALKAQEQGSSYHALMATGKRPPKAPKGKTGVAALSLHSVQTPETSDIVASVWLSYLDKAMNNKASPEYAALIRHLSSDAGRQAVLTYATIRDNLNRLFMIDQLRTIADAEKDKLPKSA